MSIHLLITNIYIYLQTNISHQIFTTQKHLNGIQIKQIKKVAKNTVNQKTLEI